MKNKSYTFDLANKKNLNLDVRSSHGGWPQGEYEPRVNDIIYNWMKDMKLIEIKNRIRKILREEVGYESYYRSHEVEPKVGEIVKNVNPKCKHKGSIGIIVKIQELDDDAGKVAQYCCLNSGKHWRKGQILSKSFDQLYPHDNQESLV